MITQQPGPGDGLADAMKMQTWPLHKAAEKSGVIADMLAGRTTLGAYVLLMQNLLSVYESLEQLDAVLQRFSALEQFFTPAMLRAEPLRRDLQAIAGDSTAAKAPLMKATQIYVGAIDRAAREDPAAMLGHLYVRYMGDLFGGQVLARQLSSTLGLNAEQLLFYNFDTLGDIASTRANFRQCFNTLMLSPGETNASIAAAKSAFESNTALSNAVKSAAAQTPLLV